MADHYENTIGTWKKLASIYHETFKDLRMYDESYEAFASFINAEKPSILEIGCGPGTVTRWLRNHLPKATILATDVSPEMIEEAKKHVEDVKFKLLDAREIDRIDESFDALFSGFCIPYLTKEDLQDFIKTASRKLNEAGIIYLSCIDGDYDSSYMQTGNKLGSMKVHLYRESDLSAFFEESGIKLLKTMRVLYPLRDGSNQTHLIVIGQKS